MKINKNNEYIKNLKGGWFILVMPALFIFLQIWLLVIGFQSLIDLVNVFEDTPSKLLVIIIITFTLMKLISWVGIDSINEFTKLCVKVMEGK